VRIGGSEAISSGGIVEVDGRGAAVGEANCCGGEIRFCGDGHPTSAARESLTRAGNGGFCGGISDGRRNWIRRVSRTWEIT
jgi:hypothetical protein